MFECPKCGKKNLEFSEDYDNNQMSVICPECQEYYSISNNNYNDFTNSNLNSDYFIYLSGL